MSTACNIIKNRVRAGNTVIGVGCYSAALTATDVNKVIKVGSTTDDPWLDFYEEVVKVNPKNPHFPKVYNIHIDYGNDYYVAVIEKLYENHDRWVGNIDGADLLEELVSQCVNDRSVSQDNFISALEDCTTCYGEVDAYQLYAACNQVQDLVRRSYREADCGCEDYLEEDEECPHTGYERLSVDLHTNNILYRIDGTLVINDPVCDTDMENVHDLSIWADQRELVA